MAIIAISGRKGGIGKTTIAANLAAEMVAAGHTVAVFDADPQSSLMAWAGLGDGVLATIVKAIDASNPARFRAAVQEAASTTERVIIDTPPRLHRSSLIGGPVGRSHAATGRTLVSRHHGRPRCHPTRASGT